MYILSSIYTPGREEMREEKKVASEKREKRNFRACENAVCAYAGKIINNFMSPDKEILISYSDIWFYLWIM